MKFARDYIAKAKNNNFETLQEAREFVNSIPKDYRFNNLYIFESNGKYMVTVDFFKGLRKVEQY